MPRRQGTNDRLALDRQGLLGARLLGQGDLVVAAGDEAGQDLAAAVDPLGELLAEDLVDVLALVETLDELGALGGAAADVEGPADEGAELVVVEDRLAVEHVGDALLEFLFAGRKKKGSVSISSFLTLFPEAENKIVINDESRDSKKGAYPHVLGKQLLAVGLGKRDLVLDLSAIGLGAHVAVANRSMAGSVGVFSERNMLAK